MPKVEVWARFPAPLQRHFIQRMRERSISLTDLNALRIWMETEPDVPEGEWYKDFGSFKICGAGAFPKTFLLPGQPARGTLL
jgi:hypothetical protein